MVCYLAFVLMIVVYCCEVIESSKISSISKHFYELTSTHGVHDTVITLELAENEFKNNETGAAKSRIKRQQSSGAGKFTDAARMPQLKLLRLFLTMFKNLWAKSYTGGSNPFHHYVPKPVVQLFKQRIVEFFFPDIGEEALKKN